MNKIRLSIIIIISCSCILVACTTTRNAAPVVDRTPATDSEGTATEVIKTPNGLGGAIGNGSDGGTYVVKKGDTLLHIALDHGQNYRDVVIWNHLTNPNDIKVGQVLRVAPLETASGVQITSVATPPSTRETSAPASGQAALVNKTSPRGEKKAYSETTLAELQKADVIVQASLVASIAAPKSAERVPATAGPAASGEDEGLSWMWPSEGKIVAGFDEGKNKGIDIAGKLGQQVLAAGAGKVMYAGSGIRGYGNLVIVKHNSNLLSAYAHNQAILVKEGQTVKQGQLIAEMGKSDSDAVKLHFEIRRQGKPVDPSKFLPTHIQ
jgi:lipoprotein NlpD